MSDFDVKEKRFEEDIEDYLTHHGGYTKGDPKKFNRESGLEEDTFVEFIKTSQPKKWERYVKIYAENSEKQIIERFKREVKTTNLLNVMRHGFMDRGIKFYPIFWKPETSLNETTQMQYDANILHCTRQLHYSVHNENSIDIVLFANGIPVVSMELKCQFTGQDTTNAINQYKFDRAGKDAIFAFKERVLVHFAVDLTNVYMTTRLEGAHTYFLPFNQGSNGAGKVGGKGNPVNPNGYDTAYLWERVLCKDSLMEILQKYMHLQQEYDKNGNLVKETMIFPRYHQLDVVTKLLEDVKKNGSGKSYLIQHSAGSGKSNSIAWLAHRLTGLHDYEDNKIFQSVIIVTDRRVLDSQLQSTVYQFDHVEGVVKKVDKNSGQLRDAINDGVGIIITTLQKFPVIYKEVDSAKKRFAIIIDEAHSSQTGDAAKKLKRALADTEEILKEYAEMEDEDERNRKDDEDKLLDELAAQGMHKNLSFFAFTATPKRGDVMLQFNIDEIEKRTLSGLKDFQRATVERVDYLFRHNQNRVLVADEVGMGKTLIARGAIVKTARLRIEEKDDAFNDNICEYDDEVLRSKEKEIIDRIAVVNVKKSNGGSESEYEDLKKYALEDRLEIKRELEIIQPDIIVCGNNLSLLKLVLGEELQNDDTWDNMLALWKDTLVLDYYHPAVHYPNRVNYYALMAICDVARKKYGTPVWSEQNEKY